MLTPKQKIVLDKIKLYISKNKISPSIRDLCFLCDLNSTQTMFAHLKKLKAKGYIDYQEGKRRTTRVMEE